MNARFLKPVKHSSDRETRVQLGIRFRAMYRTLGLDRAGAAKLLHASERTLHNWETGRHRVPYAVYRLLRILARYELPGAGWEGWLMHSGKLWSPEGHGFNPSDSAWWSLLVRRANTCHVLYQENTRLRAQARTGRASAAPHGPGRAAALDLSLGHFGTQRQVKPVSLVTSTWHPAPFLPGSPPPYRLSRFLPQHGEQGVAP